MKNLTGFRGVAYDESRSRWRATIQLNGRGKHLGYADTAEEAARLYDRGAHRYLGDKAKLNFPETS